MQPPFNLQTKFTRYITNCTQKHNWLNIKTNDKGVDLKEIGFAHVAITVDFVHDMPTITTYLTRRISKCLAKT